MRKLKSLIAVAAMAMLPFAASASVSATDSSCAITNTGPGSTNSCTVSDKYTCDVDNDNNIVVRDENDQVAGTGSATTDGNTSGGNATSGSASNDNGTTFEVTIENDGCVVTKVTNPVTPTPVRPAGGSGAAGGAGATAPGVETPTVLANTAGENPVALVFAAIATLGLATAGVHGYTALQSRK